jgi:hypothetical protein
MNELKGKQELKQKSLIPSCLSAGLPSRLSIQLSSSTVA